MLSFENVGEMLDEIALEIPEEIYRGLNGGINLLPGFKMHPADLAGDLYVLGEYCYNPQMGRYIVIYYSSFARVHGHQAEEEQRQALKDLLYHEFTHHLESMAGDRDLEYEDARHIAVYHRRHEFDPGA